MPSRMGTESAGTTMQQTPLLKPTSGEALRPSEPTEKPAFEPGLYFGGVLICRDGEKPTDEELDERFAKAEEAVWKQLHEEGVLPLRNDTEDPTEDET